VDERKEFNQIGLALRQFATKENVFKKQLLALFVQNDACMHLLLEIADLMCLLYLSHVCQTV